MNSLRNTCAILILILTLSSVLVACKTDISQQNLSLKCDFVEQENVFYAFEIDADAENAIFLSNSEKAIKTEVEPARFILEMENKDSKRVEFSISRIDGSGYVKIVGSTGPEIIDKIQCTEFKEMKF